MKFIIKKENINIQTLQNDADYATLMELKYDYWEGRWMFNVSFSDILDKRRKLDVQLNISWSADGHPSYRQFVGLQRAEPILSKSLKGELTGQKPIQN